MRGTDLVKVVASTTTRRHHRLDVRSLTTVLLGALALAGVARAEQMDVAPIAFAPANNSIPYAVEEGGLGRLCVSKGSAYFVARLQLSDGAVIEQISAFLEDTNRDGLGMMSLVRRGLEKFDVLALTPVSVGTGGVETLATTAITAPVVDNHDATYLLQVLLSGPGVCLQGARVRYRVPVN